MIGIDMELPKSCSECNFGNWVNDNIVCEINNNIIKKDSVMDKRANFCPLVDLGSEDMSWEELVKELEILFEKKQIGIFGGGDNFISIEIPNIILDATLKMSGYRLDVKKTGYLYSPDNCLSLKKSYFQMYQIIKSLVGDER